MDTKDITKIEDFLLKNKKHDVGAALNMTDVIGVLIGLKPTALIGFSSEEMKRADWKKLA